MALKKSDLYSSLWASCDELRGGMDASQYKDYVLFILFIKYITDKYGDSTDFAPPVTIAMGEAQQRGGVIQTDRITAAPWIGPTPSSTACERRVADEV